MIGPTRHAVTGLRGSFRALHIVRVLLRHRLDALLEGSPFGRWTWLLRKRRAPT